MAARARAALLAAAAMLCAAAGGAHALMPRQQAPAYKATAVVGEAFQRVDSESMKGSWQVLFFYPFDFTFVCPTEIVAFSNAVDDFAAINTKVVAVSTDSKFTHLQWVRTPRDQGGLGPVKLPLIADVSKDISRAYGMLVEDPEDELYGAALRGVFIIDPQGTIRSITVNDEAVGRSVDEAMRIVKGFQYADEHGEGCPANWQPGAKTIVPDPDASKKFFGEWSKEV